MLVITPGCWIANLDMLFHWIVGLLILVQAFRSIRLNRHPIVDSDVLEHVTSPLGEAGRLGISPKFVHFWHVFS